MAKENKRILILEALEKLLPGRRFHEITLDEVAKAAGVGKGTIYLYFKDKDALFAELVCYQLEKLAESFADLADCTIEELPRKVFDMVANFIRRHRAGFGTIGSMAIHTENLSGEQIEKLFSASNQVVSTLACAMQKAVPQWSESQSVLNARTLLWLVDGAMRSEISGGKNQLQTDELLAFYKRGAGI